MYKQRILIDLDGVLNIYGKEKFNENYIPEIKVGAKEFVAELSKNADLYLFTTRNLILTAKWLIKYELDIFFKDITNIKIPAQIYIDDRAICFKGNYNETLQEIKNFKVYYK